MVFHPTLRCLFFPHCEPFLQDSTAFLMLNWYQSIFFRNGFQFFCWFRPQIMPCGHGLYYLEISCYTRCIAGSHHFCLCIILRNFYLGNITQLCLVFLCQGKEKRTVKIMFYFINLFNYFKLKLLIDERQVLSQDFQKLSIDRIEPVNKVHPLVGVWVM